MGVQYLAVDLSEYQRGISFPRLKSEGVQGVILRGGDGSYCDKCFETFYAQAKANGLPVGAYWFSRAKTVADAEAEAERFYDRCLAGKTFELPVYLDCEADSQLRIGKRALTEAGLSIPGDVSVVGYDNIPPSAYLLPPLTTYDQDGGEIGCCCHHKGKSKYALCGYCGENTEPACWI